MAVATTRPGFRIERLVLRAPRLPAGAPPLRFAHLSDLHVSAFRARHQRLVEAVNEGDLDFVVITGDLVRRLPDGWEGLQRLVRAIRCRHGVYACRGNWELKVGMRAATLRELMADCGGHMLINESALVETASGRVFIGGVDDFCHGWPDFESALSGAAEADYAILLAHAPFAAKLIRPQDGVDLVLSGHTHGGQIRIPGIWRLVLPRYHGGFDVGLHEMPWGRLYVNRGFGGSGPGPVRLWCPPEVTVFEVFPV